MKQFKDYLEMAQTDKYVYNENAFTQKISELISKVRRSISGGTYDILQTVGAFFAPTAIGGGIVGAVALGVSGHIGAAIASGVLTLYGIYTISEELDDQVADFLFNLEKMFTTTGDMKAVAQEMNDFINEIAKTPKLRKYLKEIRQLRGEIQKAIENKNKILAVNAIEDFRTLINDVRK